MQQPAAPTNIEAEQGALGAALMSREALAALAGFLEPRHFSEELHARIYAVMLDRQREGQAATLVTLGPLLRDIKLPGEMTVSAYLAQLAVASPGAALGLDYARQLVELSRRREIMRVARDALDAAASTACGGPVARIASDAIDALNETLAAVSGARRRALGESASELMSYARDIQAGGGAPQAVTTGFKDIDDATGGYEAGTLWIVGARPGVGKTILMATSSLKTARAGARAARDGGEGFGALCYSLEVPERQITARYLSDLSYLPCAPIEYARIARGEFGAEEGARLDAATRRLAQLPLTLDASSRLTLAEIGAGVRAEKATMAKTGVRLAVVFIDYLKFIRASDRYKGQRHYEVGEISAGLKQLAKDEGLCVVLLAQLNRALETRDDKRPNLSDLRESGDLEADADVVAFLHREAHHILKSAEFRAGRRDAHERFAALEHEAELIIGKNRAGPERTARLWCLPACSIMANGGRGGGM
jgi:replicative DNA helicase